MANQLLTVKEVAQSFIDIEAKACIENDLQPYDLMLAIIDAYNAKIDNFNKQNLTMPLRK